MVTMSLRRGESVLDLGTIRKLKELVQRLTYLFICSISHKEARPIRGNLRYTGQTSGPNVIISKPDKS